MATTNRDALNALWDDVTGPYADKPVWSDAEVAQFMGWALGTLRYNRCVGTFDVPYRRIGGSCRYCPADVAQEVVAK